MADNLQRQILSLQRKLERIGNTEVPAAVNTALNRSATEVKGRTSRKVARAENLLLRTIRERMFIKRSTSRTLEARVRIYVKPVSAISQLSPSQRSGLVSGRGNAARGVKIKGRAVFKDSFFALGKAKGSSGRRMQAFQRKGRARLPVRKLGFDIQARARISIKTTSRQVMKQRFPILLRNNLDARVKRYVKSSR